MRIMNRSLCLRYVTNARLSGRVVAHVHMSFEAVYVVEVLVGVGGFQGRSERDRVKKTERVILQKGVVSWQNTRL